MFSKNSLQRLGPRSWVGIAIIIVAIVMVSLIVFGKPAQTTAEQTITPPPALQEPEVVVEQTAPQVITKTKQAKELCEDYTLTQGESLEINSVELRVDRIGQTGVKLTVNKESILLGEGEVERVDGFLIELDEENLLYFALDDPDNLVTLRLGCDTRDEEPIDKYVREKGSTVCQDLYTSCVEQFNIN